jgi:hypothetical protein
MTAETRRRLVAKRTYLTKTQTPERLNENDAPLWDDVKILAIIAAFIGGVSAFSVGVFWLLGALGQAN